MCVFTLTGREMGVTGGLREALPLVPSVLSPQGAKVTHTRRTEDMMAFLRRGLGLYKRFASHNWFSFANGA